MLAVSEIYSGEYYVDFICITFRSFRRVDFNIGKDRS